MDGGITIEQGSLHDLIRIFALNRAHLNRTPTQRFWQEVARRLRFIQQYNPIGRAKRNVSHHYDIGEDIYRLFLDRDMQYSCAYFPTGEESLEDAQTLKKRHIAAKLQIRDGQRILDIGCGWGGMGLYLAHLADVEVVGVTLSENQLKVARRRAEILGVSDRVHFELRDYREVNEDFDRIVSVGMLEHVGAGYLQEYFTTVQQRLKVNGVALIHAISSMAPPGGSTPFLHKYIFPGGYTPALSETMTAVEDSRLWLLDCEILRVHYGYTLAEWSRRFAASRDTARQIMGERFCRMWEFYLSMCEVSFMDLSSNVFQLQLGRQRDAVPITRDYLHAEESRLAGLEPQFLDRVVDSAHMALGN
nr:cyclopropane-fatty-acyl-phospholipid synthase family protein [Pseudohoeflea sp. DP4N28-3]